MCLFFGESGCGMDLMYLMGSVFISASLTVCASGYKQISGFQWGSTEDTI